MSTGIKIVQGALSRLGAHSPVSPAPPESLEAVKDSLNSMVSSWFDGGIKIGAVPLNAIGDELSEPLGLTDVVINNLAIQVQPLFPNTKISQDLRINANKGYQDMVRKYKPVTIPKPKLSTTMPLGQGNSIKFGNNIFPSDGDELG